MSTQIGLDASLSRQPNWWRRRTFQTMLRQSAAFLVVLAGAILFLIPLLWMVSASVSTNAEIFMYPPRWIPRRILLSNYPEAFRTISYWMYVRNTALITTCATIGAVLTSSLVAFGFARLRARGRNLLFLVLLGTMML